MARIENLFVNNELPKYIEFNNKVVHQVYYNGVLIWKYGDPFVFLTNEPNAEEIAKLSSNTLVFVGFSDKKIEGSYDIIESLEDEPEKQGQMVVIETTEEKG